jgi:excisionase family DNA binding protein
MTDRLLTAAELAHYIGLKPGMVLDKYERGQLPGFKFGRAVRFDLDEVLETGRPDTGRHVTSEPPAPGRVLAYLPTSEPKEAP